jgi:hypothetical protein
MRGDRRHLTPDHCAHRPAQRSQRCLLTRQPQKGWQKAMFGALLIALPSILLRALRVDRRPTALTQQTVRG